MAPTKVLVTGATGYIGGTVLDHLLKSTNPLIASLEISILTRDDSRAETFRADKKIANVYTIKDLDDSDAIADAASQNDVAIQCASGYHPGSAKALIQGLARRQAQISQSNPSKGEVGVYYMHTDGTSNLADKPITKAFIESRTFSDKDTDIFQYLKQRNETEPYPQRSTAIGVVETGLKENVPTTIVMSPTIYGLGSGQYNRLTIQYPSQMRGAMKDGQALYVGDGAGQWDYVHVQDLAVLYELILADWLSGRKAVPTGERGILFSETGNFRWKEVAEHIAKVGKELGVLKEAATRSVGLKEASEKWGLDWVPNPEQLCELGLASNSRTKSDVAREVLGWTPAKSRGDWEASIREEFQEVAKKQ